MPKILSKHQPLYLHDFHHEIFHITFYLIVSRDVTRIERVMQNNSSIKHVIPDSAAGCCAILHRENDTMIPTIVLPFDWRNTDRDIEILSHEALHAVIALMRIREIPLPKDAHHSEHDEENLCYHFSWIMANCLKFLNDKKKKEYIFLNEKIVK